MRQYTPNRWVLVKINNRGDAHYRFLAGWYGGFTSGDSWKLSSGLVEDKLTIDKQGCFVSPQSSGSCYVVHPGAYGMSMLMSSIANSFLKEAEESGGALTFEILEQERALEILNDFIKN